MINLPLLEDCLLFQIAKGHNSRIYVHCTVYICTHCTVHINFVECCPIIIKMASVPLARGSSVGNVGFHGQGSGGDLFGRRRPLRVAVTSSGGGDLFERRWPLRVAVTFPSGGNLFRRRRLLRLQKDYSACCHRSTKATAWTVQLGGHLWRCGSL